MADVFLRDDNTLDESQVYYKVKVKKPWFRGKDVFTERLHYYEKQLIHEPVVQLPLNAGNMIYTMMHRLEVGVEWEKQAALMSAYRNLVYRLSYTRVFWYQNDPQYIVMEGQKSDVMWTLAFITQVFFEDPMLCMTIPMRQEEPIVAFAIQNGEYVGKNAVISAQSNALPNIWVADTETVSGEVLQYDPRVEPQPGQQFAIPDGRVAQYIRMDERFYVANTQGVNADMLQRHNITASLIKDFEDMIHAQTKTAFDVYQLRYVAFMNKVHELENKLGGLEPTAYDVLPIAERGLPLASVDTISRTNSMDCNSLKYIYDSLRRGDVALDELKTIAKNAVRSVMMRQKGYENEYRMYLVTGTSEEVASSMYKKMISDLYYDFARLDTLRAFKFPAAIYRDLCHVPVSGGPMMTDWERQRIRLFGKGYLAFLDHQIQMSPNKAKGRMWVDARRLLDVRYMKAPRK